MLLPTLGVVESADVERIPSYRIIASEYAGENPFDRFDTAKEARRGEDRSCHCGIRWPGFVVGADAPIIEKALIEANLSGTLADVRAGRPAPPDLYDLAQ